MNVLIVDDEQTVRNAIALVLIVAGHVVCWSATGAGAMELMRTERPDVVLLDINLGEGEMTGWDVAREKTMDPSIRSIPVIVCSGMTADEVRDGGVSITNALAGAMLILEKPIDTDVLLKAIEHLAKA